MTVDFRERVRKERSLLEKIANYIPLYHGYKQKELRRESDKLLRTRIHLELENAKSSLKKARKLLVNIQPTNLFNSVDNLITLVDTASQRVNRAILGYSGFWDAVKVKEDDLDKVYEHDLKLLELAFEISSKANKLVADATTGTHEGLANGISDIQSALAEFEKAFERRTMILHGLG